jgi:ribosome-binding ATPase
LESLTRENLRFFSAATLTAAEIANYPFTTIKPNRGVGYVRSPCVHEEFKVNDNPKNSLCLDVVRLIPVELIDIAGLVPGYLARYDKLVKSLK